MLRILRIFEFWILDFLVFGFLGFWILDFGFRIFGIFDFGFVMQAPCGHRAGTVRAPCWHRDQHADDGTTGHPAGTHGHPPGTH